MSVRILSETWQHSQASGSSFLVLLAISDFANDQGTAYPSIPTLAKKSRLSERATQYAVRELVQIGELSISRNSGPHRSNVFRVMKGAKSAPSKGARSALVQNLHGAKSGIQMVQPVAPKPSIEPSCITDKYSGRPKNLEEVMAYGREISLPQSECEAFNDHFMSNGWKVGGKAPMKDWKASLRNWKRNGSRFSGNGSSLFRNNRYETPEEKRKRLQQEEKDRFYEETESRRHHSETV